VRLRSPGLVPEVGYVEVHVTSRGGGDMAVGIAPLAVAAPNAMPKAGFTYMSSGEWFEAGRAKSDGSNLPKVRGAACVWVCMPMVLELDGHVCACVCIPPPIPRRPRRPSCSGPRAPTWSAWVWTL
jgi:hypothetical protein